MAKVVVGHHPELTGESAMKIFKRQFGSKYQVYKTELPTRDFFVKKSAWVGVAVSVRQKPNQTVFNFTAISPSLKARILSVAFLGIAVLVLQRRFWKIENEIRSFIENAEEFK